MSSMNLHIIYASTSGNTEFVVDHVAGVLRDRAPHLSVTLLRAEEAQPDDLQDPDILILASGTWNTGGNEGQLNMHMHALLRERASTLDVQGKPMTFISLGDERYYFTTRCTEHFLKYMRDHNGTLLLPPLTLVNEPYGQEEKIAKWATLLIGKMPHLSREAATL